MRKRFISGLTAVCIVGVLITNMITSASAVISAAVVGASVAGSLLLGSLFNQMCGGQGYDFTNAFQDAVQLYTDWDENFDGSAKDPIHPVTKVEIDTSKVNIPDNIDFNSVGGTSADKMIVEMQKAINEGLEDGSIEINFDEDGNISMPTSSWCTSVADIYSRLGVYTSKDGTNRSRTYWSLVSPYIETTYDSWDVSLCGYKCPYRFAPLFQYVIQNDKLIIFRHNFVAESNGIYYRPVDYYVYPGSVSTGLHPDRLIYSGKYSSMDSFLSNNLSSVSVDDTNSSAVLTISNTITNDSNSLSITFDSDNNIGFGNVKFESSQPVQARGFIQVKSDQDSWNNFIVQAQEGAIDSKENNVKIPLTGVENTIGNMGLAGVGAGATKGTVSVNSKTKDITVTNEATKEAELVIEQSKPGDIDIPDNDTIIDKFPFSLPFDLYRMLTIFVVPEQKPIFTFPIETTITNGGLNYKIDEEIEVDLTRFQFMGQDIVRLVLRSTFYVGFVITLIHVTSKFIKH